MKQGHLRDGTRSWLDVEILGLRGLGRLSPRLDLRLAACTPSAGITTTLKVVRAELFWNEELIGCGLLLEDTFHDRDSQRQLELPTTRRLVQEITNHLGTSSSVSFQVRFSGSAIVTVAPDSVATASGGGSEAGQPVPVVFAPDNNTMNFSLPRTAWFDDVVGKLGDSDYIPLELLVPRSALGEPWRKALSHVTNAKRAHALGDDPAVFGHLRGALDSVPGAKQEIFDALPEPKRTEVDALVTALGKFLHAGRHIDQATGGFPVDHIDAGFALNLMDVLLSYASRALEAAATR